jgi:hypothetical protein
MFWLSLTSKLGFHPLTKAVLVAIPTSPPKWPPIGPYQLKIAEICNALVGLCCLYVLEII